MRSLLVSMQRDWGVFFDILTCFLLQHHQKKKFYLRRKKKSGRRRRFVVVGNHPSEQVLRVRVQDRPQADEDHQRQ